MDRALRQICDFLTAIALVICISCFACFTTLGNPNYYTSYYNKADVNDLVEDKITQGTDEIANITGIEKGAFDYVLERKIDLNSVENRIPFAIFNGVNANYSDTENLDEAYYEGLIEYHNLNGISYSDDVIKKATQMACENFDNALGSDQMNALSKGIGLVDKNAKIGGVIGLIGFIFLMSRTFALSFGRTRAFSHAGSALIGSGSVFITCYVMNSIIGFVDRLNITGNEIIRGSIIYGVDKYFKTLAIIGVALIIIGLVCMRYVYDYYTHKHSKELEEKLINEKVRNDAQNALEYTNNQDNLENGDNENGIN